MVQHETKWRTAAAESLLAEACNRKLEGQLSAINSQRDALAGQIIRRLEAAEFEGQPLGSGLTFGLVQQIQQLLRQLQNSNVSKP